MQRLRFLTAGESHGKALNAIIEGLPAGLCLSEADMNRDLERRQCGYGRGGRMKIEQDTVEVLSGIRHGRTLGSPVSLIIRNKDWVNWQQSMSVAPVESGVEPVTRPRPGHADLAGVVKYGFADIRNVLERASARESATRVAAGAAARRLIAEFGVEVHSRTVAIGGCQAGEAGNPDWARVEASPVRCADPEAEKEIMALIDEAGSAGDTLGGVTEIVASGVPVGLGSHVHWDRRLDGRLAQAVMSINSVKGVEIGAGLESAGTRGSLVQDAIRLHEGLPRGWRRTGNSAGGIEGGISNGEAIVVRAAIKPVPTLRSPLPSIDLHTRQEVEAHHERSDICVVPAVGVIGEAMVTLVLADAFLEKFGGDSIEEMQRNYTGYLARILL